MATNNLPKAWLAGVNSVNAEETLYKDGRACKRGIVLCQVGQTKKERLAVCAAYEENKARGQSAEDSAQATA